MDDFNISSLTEARNEYTALFINKIQPHVYNGIQSIFNEAKKLCDNNDEEEKYLMTFQNFLSRVTKWSSTIVDEETNRIINESGCSYLEELLTCVHITQMKILTSIRVGTRHKKMEIDIPSLNTFIHKVYIECSRQLYKNVFLFDYYTNSLKKQKNLREIEHIIKECILNTIRASIPVETILRKYLEETTEEDSEITKEKVQEVVKEEILEDNEIVDNKETENNLTNIEENKKENDDSMSRELKNELNEIKKSIETTSETKESDDNKHLMDTNIEGFINKKGLSFNTQKDVLEFDNTQTTTSISSTPSQQQSINNVVHKEDSDLELSDIDDGYSTDGTTGSTDERLVIKDTPISLDNMIDKSLDSTMKLNHGNEITIDFEEL